MKHSEMKSNIALGFLTITTFKIVKLLSFNYHKFLVYYVIFCLSFVWLMEINQKIKCKNVTKASKKH